MVTIIPTAYQSGIGAVFAPVTAHNVMGMSHVLAPVGRVVALALAVVLLTASALLAPGLARAYAGGGLVTAPDSQAEVSGEVAAISWDGNTQRTVLSLNVASQATETGLLLPTPAPAKVELADPEVFTELAQITAPQVEVEYHWWPRTEGDGGGGQSGGGGAADEGEADDGAAEPAVSGAGVQVLDQVDLGSVEASVLRAADADELAAWLDTHGYEIDDDMAQAITPYVTEGWYYVAVRITADEPLTGSLTPLDITFESSAVVHPMRTSAAASTASQVRTYVFADQRMTRADATASGHPPELRYAGVPDPGQVESGTVAELLRDAPYLTVMDQTFDQPGAQVVSDFVFERSSNGGDHQEIVVTQRLRTIVGLPAGPATLGLGLLVVAAGTLLLVRRRRRDGVTALAA